MILTIHLENKIQIVSQEVKRTGSIRLGIIDKNGDLKNTDGTAANVKERPYLSQLLNKMTNEMMDEVNKFKV